MPKLTKGSKQRLAEFNKYVKLRRAYILGLLQRYSKVYQANKNLSKNRMSIMNAMHHNVLNNLRVPKTKYWRKKNGKWECNGCRLK